VHAYIISELKEEMPSMFGKDSKKKELIKNLDKIYEKIQRQHNISPGDFPNIAKMREVLEQADFRNFKQLDKKLIDKVENMLSTDITQLMQMLPREESYKMSGSESTSQIRAGAFDDQAGPFGIGTVEGINAGVGESDWIVDRNRTSYDDAFIGLNPVDGKITGASAKSELIKSKLPNSVLAKVWRLADHDKDGMLDKDEWALANYLIKIKLDGFELPNSLPDHLVPPAKRKLFPNLLNGQASSSFSNDE
jgi:EH domain-containing protein 1